MLGIRLPLLLVTLLLTAVASVGASAQSADQNRSPALCAPGDPNPEPGVQGDVPSGAQPAWDCGVQPVGFLAGANGSMAVAAHCAYTGGGALGSGEGVRVIDVSNPARPRLVRVLNTGSRELLAATIVGDRGLLATRHRAEAREGQVLGRDMYVDIWDILADCTSPKLLGTLRLPTTSDIFGDPPGEVGGPVHNLKFNPSATKLYGSLPMHEIDLRNLKDPSTWTARNLHCAITEQTYPPHQPVPGLCDQLTETESPMGAAGGYPSIDHEPTFNVDGSRLYVGGQLPDPYARRLLVLDMTGPDPVVLSVTEDAPGHAIDPMTIGGRKYLLHSNELSIPAACVPEDVRPNFLGLGDRAFVLDITNEKAPVKVSQIMLADSKFSNCGPSGGGPSTAYHEVDDPANTTYAVIGFESGGLRFFDMRDPRNPVEVAYWNHGSAQHTKSYVIPETGHIWASDASGFWVLDLEPHVRQHLGLSSQSGTDFSRVLPTQTVAPTAGLPATGGRPDMWISAALLTVALAVRYQLRARSLPL